MIFIRILLFPFTLVYDAITRFRNHLFNIGNKPSFQFETNVIGVGNLSVGGTGKTPMVEYLIRLLTKYEVTTLSRGYGRKTKGFRIAEISDSPNSIGDEPFQIFKKFKNIHVTVGEERALAIPEILHQFPKNEIIVLDDAFQHRYVKPNLNILLTDFNKPFFNDYVLPTGKLREARKGAQRADVVVITKCPIYLDNKKKQDYVREVSNYKGNDKNIFFSTISYDKPLAVNHEIELQNNILLFSGIASNHSLKAFVSENYNLLETISFPDHHRYTITDLKKIINSYKQKSRDNNCSIMTTEKDMVKLNAPEFKECIKEIPLFYLPIKTTFLENGEIFDKEVLNSIQTKR